MTPCAAETHVLAAQDFKTQHENQNPKTSVLKMKVMKMAVPDVFSGADDEAIMELDLDKNGNAPKT